MNNFLLDLGLTPGKDYTPDEVKKAWKKKCTEHHPDKGGDPNKFRAVTHAYKMLTDPSYRREEAESKRGKKGDLNIRMQVPVTFEDAFFGREFVVSYNRVELNEAGEAIVKPEQEIITLTLRCQPGSLGGPNNEHVFHGKGLKCGETFGDVHLMICPRPHPKFQVEDMNVLAQEKVPLDMALKGGEFEVQTLWGLKTVKVPPGTRPGDRLEIKRCGVAQRGKHLVVVDIVYPSQEELKQKEAWKGLDINWENHKAEVDPAEEFEEMFIRLGGNPKIIFTTTNMR